MAESTLASDYSEISRRVGTFLGWGSGGRLGDRAWSAAEQQDVNDFVRSGIRMVHNCGYDWSFTKPVTTLTLPSGANTLQLPDDFAGIEDKITLTASSSRISCAIPICNPGQIREKYVENPLTTGRPEIASVQPLKGTHGTQGQRQQLYWWPTTDQAYSVQFAYYLNVDFLTGAFPYPYGGAQHAETYVAAAKAAAELDRDDILGGPQAQNFARLLEASKDIDRRNKAQTLGYNGDASNNRGRPGMRHFRETGGIRVGGTQY